MQKGFVSYIQKEKLFHKTEKILLTVSGGIDSVVMCELFHKAGYNFGIAHCNFQLRNNESDADEIFVEALAEKYHVEFHSIAFDTSAFAKKNKLSIQLAARELRYQWFEEIRSQYEYSYIATAHHQDDSIETFFINLIRGTGISGLHGILNKYGKIVRPLLFCRKNEIEIFAKKNKLKHREDSSNASDKYTRNKIRHQIIPLLKDLNPNLENTISRDMERLKNVELIYRTEIAKALAKISKKEKEGVTFSIKKLKKISQINTYLYEFLKPYQFNATTVEEIISAFDGESGKQFFSSTHRLIKDRNFLLLENRSVELKNKPSVVKYLIKKNTKKFTNDSVKLKLKTGANVSELNTSNNIALIDFDKLVFPLEIRKWEKGDIFYPLGMKGKKKVSDFFIDKKLSLFQKESTNLLISKGEIVWIIGLRLDERFKITEKTKKIYFVEQV
jgi:tRNA(Ile)-lysidine synthase